MKLILCTWVQFTFDPFLVHQTAPDGPRDFRSILNGGAKCPTVFELILLVPLVLSCFQPNSQVLGSECTFLQKPLERDTFPTKFLMCEVLQAAGYISCFCSLHMHRFHKQKFQSRTDSAGPVTPNELQSEGEGISCDCVSSV